MDGQPGNFLGGHGAGGGGNAVHLGSVPDAEKVAYGTGGTAKANAKDQRRDQRQGQQGEDHDPHHSGGNAALLNAQIPDGHDQTGNTARQGKDEPGKPPGTGSKADSQIESQAGDSNQASHGLSGGADFFSGGFRLRIAFPRAGQHSQGHAQRHHHQQQAQSHLVLNEKQGQGAENVAHDGQHTQQRLPFGVYHAFLNRLGDRPSGFGRSAAGAAQNFVDVSDAGNGQPVGGLRSFALGNQVVIAIQGILQNFLLNVPGVFRTGKQQLHIAYQLFPH